VGRTGYVLCKVLNASTGHAGDPGMEKRVMRAVCRCLCSVFDHLIKIEREPLNSVTSPLLRCLIGSKELGEGGATFEIRKRAMNDRIKADL
jgi:hypothetical protein